MKLLLILAASIAPTSLSFAQTTWYVDSNGTPPGSGTPADPYTSIQFAIAQPATAPGDTVSVAPGTYANEAVDFLGKDIAVVSQGGSGVTTVVAPPAAGPVTYPVVRFANGETTLAELRGFTLTGGSGEPTMTPWAVVGGGGGIFCEGASPRILECVITGNSAMAGAGVYARSSALRLEDCSIRANGSAAATLAGGGLVAQNARPELVRVELLDHAVDWTGGGAYLLNSQTTIAGSTVTNNTTQSIHGGGIAVAGGSALIADTLVRGNRAGFSGGGISVRSGADATITDSVVELNLAFDDAPYSGGGIFVEGASLAMSGTAVRGNVGQFGGGVHAQGTVSITGCTIEDNQAHGSGNYSCGGGGLFVQAGVTTVDRTVFQGNTAEDTYSFGGGGVFGPADLSRCTLHGNRSVPDGGGASGATLVDCIVWGSSPDQLASSVATYSDVQGGWPGTGNIDVDPLFWSAAALDFRLLPGSPCIDAGDPASPPDPDSTRADMGAFPYDPTYCGTGCDGPIGVSYCTAAANSSGSGASLSALGTTTLLGNLVLLRVTSLPVNEPGYFLMADSQGFVPMLGGGQGNLCLGLPIVRFAQDVLFSGLLGEVDYRVRTDALPQGVQFMVGETWNFQLWFRDSNPQPTSNTSDGLSITWQ